MDINTHLARRENAHQAYKNKLMSGVRDLAIDAAGRAFSKDFKLVIYSVIADLKKGIESYDGSPEKLHDLEKQWTAAQILVKDNR